MDFTFKNTPATTPQAKIKTTEKTVFLFVLNWHSKSKKVSKRLVIIAYFICYNADKFIKKTGL